ncbi:MAG: dienelactone hydrolase family protein [Gammaproteobacteria bacterium]|nr:dienelactone hydrolase family protein [Gammaproteobacteria bacterium]MXW45183.1 dienelactone hydrolase family protein [Gammaproteobacteria bacterium]MYD01843.1 dienelactone hydrolase family protein [Gammaproteobacteria bacterium]MYI26052.1 dienelactone hydrolase family protein [Gammaproteobacteria bacterium]
MAIRTRDVEYSHGDKVFEARMYWDDARGPAPAVAVAHAWSGRAEHECEAAEKLAGEGYVGIALDVYGKGVLGQSVEENMALMNPLIEDRALLQARLLAGLECAAAQPEVDGANMAVIGYCFGGLCVLDLARVGAPVKGVVSLHGLFNPPGNTEGNSIGSKVLVLHGWADPMVPPDTVVGLATEMTEAGADWQIHAYGHALHGFTHDAPALADGIGYSESADRRSWQSVLNFMAELFD